jgi:hypothetical protein
VVLIGAILNACKISQCQYCGAIHELETDPKKNDGVWFQFLKMGHMVAPFLKKKWATLRKKRRRKKIGNNNEKIYSV